MITTVAFDADDTLIDIRTAVRAGLNAVLAAAGAPRLTLASLEADAAEFWARIPHRPAAEVRAAALRHTLERAGLEEESDRMVEVFFEARFAQSRPFPGVLDVLAKLTSEYRLGYATNANSRADRCGLGGRFAFEIYAMHDGVPKKPAVEFFHAVIAAARSAADEIVYVGDSYHHDVFAANRAGLRTVWLNPHGLPVPGEAAPDAVISSLAQLPDILADFNGGP